MNTSVALHLEDVVFRYYEHGKRNILDHVSLDIAEGGVTVLMGSSGCGKSTLMSVAAGLYPENGGFLESGKIELYGQSVSGMNQQDRAAYLTLMFQNPDLQFCMNTLRKEMQFCMENICVPQSEMDQRLMQAAETLGVVNLLDRKLTTLSGGEKQRAALCCLYVMESRCIVLDEAFANIDEDGIRELMKVLRILSQQGRTIIAIDHRLDYWLELADEIIVLGQGGKVLLRGITGENLEEYRPLFLQEGLFLPQSEKSKALKKKSAGQTQPQAVELRHFSVKKHTEKKRFGKRIPGEYLICDGNASFPEGAITAVLGASGSGKTTMFLSILKQHPYEGTVLVWGRDLGKMKKNDLFAEAGMVFQNPANQFVALKVQEEVESSLRIWEKGLSKEACEKKAGELLESYGLQRYHRYSPYMLSQGQQRRLAVLSVLAGKQRILFLDEPTYGQDYRSTMAIMEQLRRKVEEEHLTVVFITHDAALAEQWADKIYRLKDQKLVDVTEEGGQA